ncbi:lysophospholipid acyltransferase family protein [Sphingomonas sp. 1P06PA]|uniref:lysophospholipid acyltransferase family protein n=1 Tax=Sphingomonas sp. 1P06PA TaxID=554121 RepID=UPI0039A63897
MIFLRSLLFTILFYLGSIGAVLIALAIASFSDKAVRDHAERWARYHRWCARHILGIETRVEGTLPTGTALIAAKHQSMYETLEMLVLIELPAVVVKRELADMPGWGKVARRHGVIPVDREGSSSALRRMLAAARAAQAEGRSIVIFPEGTRVPPGETPALKPGFAGLYRQLGLPVVPVAIDSGRLYPRRGFLKYPGVITFRFGAPIPPGLPRREAEQRVWEEINRIETGGA